MGTENDFHNRIANICLERFNTLPKTGKPTDNEWTILSCMVQECNDVFTVVALGTGTKCIGVDKMSSLGDILNDSHAEVMCRRGFLRYIYHQMKQQNSIFTFNKSTKKFVLKPNINYHFFTTHVPCGDAAIFAKSDSDDVGNVIGEESEGSAPKRVKLKKDVYRTGAKCLKDDEKQDAKMPGSEYHTVGCVRTKPGRGTPTLSVSCSDKLSKWCHLGIQGALLSSLLEAPIYMSTFTITGGVPFSGEAFNRALYERLGKVTLDEPYHQHVMIFGQSDYSFMFSKNNERRPCSSCIVWCDVNSQSLEVAVDGKRQGVVKKRQNTEIARLKICKLELFKLWKEICVEKHVQIEEEGKLLTYLKAKLSAKNYQNGWTSLRKSFKTWTAKNECLLEFYSE